jgi:hypothetical protein
MYTDKQSSRHAHMPHHSQQLDGRPLGDREIERLIDERMPAPLPETERLAEWRGLTALEQKHEEYWREVAFREALEDAKTILGDSYAGYFQRVAVVVFRPEAFAARRVKPALDFLKAHSYLPILADFLHVDGRATRDIWRYQWNVATLDRVAVFDLLSDQAPWLFLTLADQTSVPRVPASVRLRGLKGSAIPENRDQGTLRSICAAPNRILSMLHAPDEPADILRELGILHDSQTRTTWLTSIKDAFAIGPREVDTEPAIDKARRHVKIMAFRIADVRVGAAGPIPAHPEFVVWVAERPLLPGYLARWHLAYDDSPGAESIPDNPCYNVEVQYGEQDAHRQWLWVSSYAILPHTQNRSRGFAWGPLGRQTAVENLQLQLISAGFLPNSVVQESFGSTATWTEKELTCEGKRLPCSWVGSDEIWGAVATTSGSAVAVASQGTAFDGLSLVEGRVVPVENPLISN